MGGLLILEHRRNACTFARPITCDHVKITSVTASAPAPDSTDLTDRLRRRLTSVSVTNNAHIIVFLFGELLEFLSLLLLFSVLVFVAV